MDRARPVSLTVLAGLVALRFALPLVTRHGAWGFHRDEFLYFAMADHLTLSGMQFPPMIAMIAAAGRAVFGESVLSARVPAALGGAAITLVVLLFVRRLGGGRVACVLAWLALLAAPLFVRSSVLMHPVVFDQLWATIALTALTLAAQEREPRWWLAVGVGLGLGALTKFSVAFTGLSVLSATLCVPALRAQLRTRWPWIAVLLGATLSLPGVMGQVTHHWPFLQQMTALRRTQLDRVGVDDFLVGQAMMLAGALTLVLPALWSALRGEPRDRPAAIAGATLVGLMLVLHGKDYYAGPAYPVLIGTGALVLETLFRTHRVARGVTFAVLAVTAIGLWPIGVPSVGPAGMLRYTAAMGLAESIRTNRGLRLLLPQDYADMLGWRELADSVGASLSSLSAAERDDLTLVGGNYGLAGALAFYRDRDRLPYAVSVRGDFWAWGPGSASGNSVMYVGDSLAYPALARLYETVRVLRTVDNPWMVPEEQHVLIYHAKGARTPLAALWPSLGPQWD
jgi:hypothetical protein